LVFDPSAKASPFTKEDNAIVLPAQGGGFEEITKSAADIMRKVNALPFAEIGKNLNDTLASVNGLAGSPELKQAVQSLTTTLASVQQLVQKTDSGLTPMLKRLPEIANNLQETAARASHLMGSIDATYGGNSNFNRQLDRLLDQVTEAARTIRELADLLDRHPEALIRGRTGQVLDK
jgi:paraquat-inducible protein B